MNLSIIIQAIDRVTGPARAIAGRLRSSLDGLGLPRIQEALSGVVGGVGRVIGEIGRLGRVALLAGGVAGGALLGIAQSAINAGDAAVKAAASVGISAESWQRFAYAADLAGVGSDQSRMALQELSKQVADAVGGNQQLAATFRDMGVELRDSEGKLRAVDRIMADVADAFARAPDGPRKTRVAMQLLGGEGAKLIPLLNGGSQALRAAGDEAERLGLVISGDTAAKMEAFNDNLSRVRGFVTGLRNSIAEQLIPVIGPLLERFVSWLAANRELIASRIVEWIKAIPPAVESLVSVLSDLYGKLQPVASALGDVVRWLGPAETLIGAVSVVIGAKLIAALLQLGAALVPLGAALLATPLGWFLGAIALIGAAAYLVWRNWEPISAFFAGLWQQLQRAGAAFVAWMEGTFLAGWQGLAGAVMAIWQPIEPWATALWASVQAIFDGFADFVNGVFNGRLTAAFEGLIQAGRGVRDAFVTFWQPVVAAFTAFVSWVDSAFAGRLSAAVDAAWQAIRPVVETIVGAFDRVMGVAGRVADIGRSVTGGIADAAGGLLSRAGALVGLSSPAEAATSAAAAPTGAADVRPAVQRIDTSGVVTVKIDQEGRARVADVRPANPDQDWRIERGLSLAGVP